MSWMSRLYTTYEQLEKKSMTIHNEITPIAHMNANAQLEVSVNVAGDFLGAVSVEKENAVTLIPVSEASASRSGVAPPPHALCDMLPYVAGDFEDYCRKKDQKNGPKTKFEKYIKNLQSWAESTCSHPKVRAIYAYLAKKCLIADLISAGLVELDAEHFFENKKISGQPYERVLVRFRVVSSDFETEDATWRDNTLIQAYTEYYLANQKGLSDICYFTGQEKVISQKHPNGIVEINTAKLVSANDDRGFTYRGRFQNADQAFALSYEASQKIHSALTWLAKNQGVYAGTKDKRTFLCWNPDGKKVPNIADEFGSIDDEPNEYEYAAYEKKLRRMFQGYQDGFDGNEPVVVMGLDAATTGRLSVTYYNEFAASDFFDRLLYWGETCNWAFLKFNERKLPYYNRETPIFRRIAECAFGREKERFIELDDRVLKEQTQRLMKCMLEKQPIPYDIVQALTVRASTPMAYSRNNRERVLSTACALISKYHIEKRGKEKGEDMKLQEENQDRSYLFGRLLAVCEKVERSTYDKNEGREPNAIRMQSVYVNHPLHTLHILQGLLEPYFRKLPIGLREYYRNMIGEIMEKFREEDVPKMNQSLSETYLLGYYLQRAELNDKKKKDTEGGEEHEYAAEQD